METSVVLDISANIVALAGVLVFAIAAIGLFKFTDTYQRISAVGTAAGPGISLIVIGVFMMTPSWSNFVQLLIILFLQLATSSIGTMAIARSSYLTGTKLQPGYFDHLAEDQGEYEETGDVELEAEKNVDEDTNQKRS